MPPIFHKGETVGHYADHGSDEWLEHAADPELRQMPAIASDQRTSLGFTLFIPEGHGVEPAASELLDLKGIHNTIVHFIRPDASIQESGSYTLELHRR